MNHAVIVDLLSVMLNDNYFFILNQEDVILFISRNESSVIKDQTGLTSIIS